MRRSPKTTHVLEDRPLVARTKPISLIRYAYWCVVSPATLALTSTPPPVFFHPCPNERFLLFSRSRTLPGVDQRLCRSLRIRFLRGSSLLAPFRRVNV